MWAHMMDVGFGIRICESKVGVLGLGACSFRA